MLKKILLVLALIPAAVLLRGQNGPVRAWEGTIELPTYRVAAPETAPLFERDFAYQRAKRGVYPYAMNDNPTNVKVDSSHRALFLENDYVKVCVLPPTKQTAMKSSTARVSSSPRTSECLVHG